MMSVRSAVDDCVAHIRRRWSGTARVGLILGTGLGRLAEQIKTEIVFPYWDLPHFPRATVPSHKGRLVCGSLHGAVVAAMDGRCHLYEGYTVDEITHPVRVMRSLGAELLIITNAGGGLNPQLAAGDVVAIADHINLIGRRSTTPAPGVPFGRPCRRDASPYDAALIDQALEIARRANFAARRGVYVAVTGPNYETRAEYRFLRRIGGDVVGMSTVPEAIVAAECGMRVLALSTVTNVALPDARQRVDARDVVDVAEQAEPKLRKMVIELLRNAA